jgi:hypothetical protein
MFCLREMAHAGSSGAWLVQNLSPPCAQPDWNRGRPDAGSNNGSGVFTGLSLTASLLMSIVLDQFGLVGFKTHPSSALRITAPVCGRWNLADCEVSIVSFNPQRKAVRAVRK